ncbi:MAG TPA: ABC transporter substrate binding protein, partial [Candidatus Saccharimonadia bacterium]|nr:ABC transporter substrate binding protein [Candidatus Saccharimonadia bacterium]
MLGERSLTDPFLAAFRQGLRELGYTEGQSIVIEERYTHGVLDRVPTLAVELLRLKVDVLVVGGTVAAQAAKALTTMVPIVFTLPGDPVGSGLVASRARPSGNATELSTSVSGLSGKQLEFLVLEYRAAAGHYERFPALVAELVQLKPDVIVTQGLPAALATKDATTTVPIVMVGVGNPVGSGLVASLARPGGNITGLSTLCPELVGKQLEFLKDVLPTVSRVAVLWNPANPARALQVRAADVAAPQLGVQMHLVEARGADAFDSVFAAMTSAHTGALLVLVDNIFFEHRR